MKVWGGRSRLGWPVPVVVAAVVVLLVACTGGESPGGQGSPSPVVSSDAVGSSGVEGSPEPTGSPVPVGPTEEDLAVKFVLEVPEEPCPPVSALRSLPAPVEGREYVLHDPFLDVRAERVLEICTYKLDGWSRNEALLEGHVYISVHITLYRDWADSPWQGFRPLPVSSDDLEVWSASVLPDTRIVDPWWEGCAGAVPCAEGEEPTVRTRAHENGFLTHAGNLEFYVHVLNIGERVPADAEARAVAIFRELVLAAMAYRELVE